MTIHKDFGVTFEVLKLYNKILSMGLVDGSYCQLDYGSAML